MTDPTKIVAAREAVRAAPSYVAALDSQNWESITKATPSVANVRFLTIHSSFAGGIITNFLDGQDTQTLKILGDGSTTVDDNTNIKRPGGSAILAAATIYTFTLFIDPSSLAHIWYEDV